VTESPYKPVPHEAPFRKALLAKPGVKKAFDALEKEYTALHAMLDARQAAGLTQADMGVRMAPRCLRCLCKKLIIQMVQNTKALDSHYLFNSCSCYILLG
jgi:hypothetical protein